MQAASASWRGRQSDVCASVSQTDRQDSDSDCDSDTTCAEMQATTQQCSSALHHCSLVSSLYDCD